MPVLLTSDKYTRVCERWGGLQKGGLGRVGTAGGADGDGWGKDGEGWEDCASASSPLHPQAWNHDWPQSRHSLMNGCRHSHMPTLNMATLGPQHDSPPSCDRLVFSALFLSLKAAKPFLN